MAKINHFIATYSDAIIDLDIPVDNTVPPKAVIRRFLRLLKDIDDSGVP